MWPSFSMSSGCRLLFSTSPVVVVRALPKEPPEARVHLSIHIPAEPASESACAA